MFDIGGWEFLIIIIVAIVIIGPKDLPGMIRSVMGWVRKARELARKFQSGIDDLAQEVELEKIGEEFKNDVGLGETGEFGNTIHQEITNAIDPSGEVTEAVDSAKEFLEDDLAKIQEDLDHQEEFGDPLDDVEQVSTKDKNKTSQSVELQDDSDQAKT